MNNMKITTESGAVYLIERGVCYKTSHEGYEQAPFKVWVMKPLPEDIESINTWDDIRDLPEGAPVVDRRLYIAGRDIWWISTPVVRIEE